LEKKRAGHLIEKEWDKFVDELKAKCDAYSAISEGQTT
jgi:hypothetical protein